MNLNYINFNTSLGEMLTSAVGENIKADLNENSVKGLGKDTAFAEKLMALLSPETKQTSTLLNSNFKGITGAGEDLFDTGKGTSDDPVLDFINEFKNYLKMAGVVLENATIDKKGIAALEELLVAQGFSREDIKGLVADLMDEDTELTGLAELVDGLETLDLKQTNLENEEKDEDSIILPISDLPFITSILTALGIPEDFSKNLLSEVKEEGAGINLDGLIQGLQGLQKQSFLSGISYTAGSQTGGVEQMFQALGLETQGGGASSLTLVDFVTALEQMRASNSQLSVSSPETFGSESLNALKLVSNGDVGVTSAAISAGSDILKSFDNSQLSGRLELLNALKLVSNGDVGVTSAVTPAVSDILKSFDNSQLSGRLELLNALKLVSNGDVGVSSAATPAVSDILKSFDNSHLSGRLELLNALKLVSNGDVGVTSAAISASSDILKSFDNSQLSGRLELLNALKLVSNGDVGVTSAVTPAVSDILKSFDNSQLSGRLELLNALKLVSNGDVGVSSAAIPAGSDILKSFDNSQLSGRLELLNALKLVSNADVGVSSAVTPAVSDILKSFDNSQLSGRLELLNALKLVSNADVGVSSAVTPAVSDILKSFDNSQLSGRLELLNALKLVSNADVGVTSAVTPAVSDILKSFDNSRLSGRLELLNALKLVSNADVGVTSAVTPAVSDILKSFDNSHLSNTVETALSGGNTGIGKQKPMQNPFLISCWTG